MERYAEKNDIAIIPHANSHSSTDVQFQVLCKNKTIHKLAQAYNRMEEWRLPNRDGRLLCRDECNVSIVHHGIQLLLHENRLWRCNLYIDAI